MIVAPSLLSADFGNLKAGVDMINDSCAEWLHCDVMDGVFVPNISFGFPVISAIRKLTDKVIDAHLMIVEPQNYITRVRDCGVDIMNIHVEACTHLNRTVNAIKATGMKAAVTLNPSTPVMMLEDIITDVDMVLLMSVNPGFGGQSFIPNTIQKIKRLRNLITQSESTALIQVDGGVNLETAPMIAKAGADVLVAGNAVFSAPDPKSVISQLSSLSNSD